jgi:exopolysaccharide biosynthesis WecB/TagA/CpsF family protein
MKITIITPTLNNEKTILDTLDSVSGQSYRNIEHLIVDGGSKDQTLEIIENYNGKKIKILKKKTNIYEAINYGIKNSKGIIIGILGADDIYQNRNVLKDVSKKFYENLNTKVIIGSLVYFANKNYNKILRYYPNNNFSQKQFKYGMMPPHPSTFIKKSVYDKIGLYDESIHISSDFKFFLKLIYKENISYKFFNRILVRMRMGGVSTKNFLAPFKITLEIYKILKDEKIFTNYFFLIFRFLLKSKQFLFTIDKVNKDFKLIDNIKKRRNENLSFKIINSPNILIKKNKNFVLSALNLAYLGYFGVAKVRQYKNLYHWPDGYYSKKIYPNIKKIPGRVLIKKIKNHRNIKGIHVVGNLNPINRKYLNEKFVNKKIRNTSLPILNDNEIKKYVPKLKKGELVLITLPTPKQEIMAEYLVEINKNFRIICIGASLNLISNFEKPVPTFLYKLNLEWLWRLKTDPKRRIIRIIQSYFYYTKSYFKGVYKNVIFK